MKLDSRLGAGDIVRPAPRCHDSVKIVQRKCLKVLQEILSDGPLELPPSIQYQKGRATAIQFAAQIARVRESLSGSELVLYLGHSFLEGCQLPRRVSNMALKHEYG